VLNVSTPRVLPSLAVSAEARWDRAGGVRLQAVGSDSVLAVRDAAGAIDSVVLADGGAQVLSGPVQGALIAGAPQAVAVTLPITVAAPQVARVLVVGNATWESRFLIATLEEAGWPVDAAVTLAPRVTVSQGAARLPTRSRHEIVVLLPGALPSVIAALPAFVRDGGGLVVVGEAARSSGLAALRAGIPGGTVDGEAGAESSEQPRHGLDMVPMVGMAPDAVVLERRDANIAIAARRVGAGRVLQVGYENSWLWRMAGNDDAPDAHRRWWSALLSGLVSMRAPMAPNTADPSRDTTDAAPTAALVRDLGAPEIRASIAPAIRQDLRHTVDLRWLLSVTLLALVSSWVIRRWRGLA
jgi:hypothetical protein